MVKDFKLASDINLRGNLIDNDWYKHLTITRGNETIPNVNAIIILSEIVYWYRPTEIYTNDGKLIYKKKFKYDLLQKSYSEFCNKFGFTKNQVKNATDYLVNIGLIVKEFRNITINGKRISNVLFIGLNIENLLKISSPEQIKTVSKKEVKETLKQPIPKQIEPIKVEQPRVVDLSEGGMPLQSDTYTKNTTNTKNKESNLIDSTTKESVNNDLDLDLIIKQAETYAYSNKPELKASIESTIIELCTKPNIANILRIGLSNQAIQLIIKNIRIYHIDRAIELCIKYNARKKTYFMKTLLTVIQEYGIDDYVGVEQIGLGKTYSESNNISNLNNFEQRNYSSKEFTDLENAYLAKIRF